MRADGRVDGGSSRSKSKKKGKKRSQLAGLNDGPLYRAVKNYKYRMIPLHQAGVASSTRVMTRRSPKSSQQDDTQNLPHFARLSLPLFLPTSSSSSHTFLHLAPFHLTSDIPNPNSTAVHHPAWRLLSPNFPHFQPSFVSQLVTVGQSKPWLDSAVGRARSTLAYHRVALHDQSRHHLL